MSEVRSLSKSFLEIKAFDNVDSKIEKSEIHAIASENGAGKSTLISIISGVIRQDKGEIFIDGVKENYRSVREAKRKGISTVYQELSLFPKLSC